MIEQIILSCHNLIETNDGKFKSEKQKTFLLSQSFDGMITHSGKTFKTQWIEYFVLDEQGVVAYQRSSNKKGLVTLWERGQKTAKQKSRDRHENNLAKHKILENEIFKEFEKRCLEKYGYVLDAKKLNDLRDAAYKSSRFLMVVEKIGFDNVTNEMAVAFAENKPIMDNYREMIKEREYFLHNFRVWVLENYKLKFQLSFLSIE